MTKNFIHSFLLKEKKQKFKTANTSHTFLSVRKVSKEACTLKEILKLSFVPLKENNSPPEGDSNRFSFFTFHYGKFLNEFHLRCGELRRNLFEVGENNGGIDGN